MFVKRYHGPVNPFALPGLINDYKMNLKPNLNNVDLNYFLELVADDGGVKPDDILNFSRKREKVLLRKVFCYLAKKYTKYTLEEIGEFLNGRDHTTVIHSLSTLQDLMDTEDDVRDYVERLDRIVSGYSSPEEIAYEVVGGFKYFGKQ